MQKQLLFAVLTVAHDHLGAGGALEAPPEAVLAGVAADPEREAPEGVSEVHVHRVLAPRSAISRNDAGTACPGPSTLTCSTQTALVMRTASG